MLQSMKFSALHAFHYILFRCQCHKPNQKLTSEKVEMYKITWLECSGVYLTSDIPVAMLKKLLLGIYHFFSIPYLDFSQLDFSVNAGFLCKVDKVCIFRLRPFFIMSVIHTCIYMCMHRHTHTHTHIHISLEYRKATGKKWHGQSAS